MDVFDKKFAQVDYGYPLEEVSAALSSNNGDAEAALSALYCRLTGANLSDCKYFHIKVESSNVEEGESDQVDKVMRYHFLWNQHNICRTFSVLLGF